MHLHFHVPTKIRVTLSEQCISHSARFKNTMIELLKSSTDPQISKGVDALKQLFLKKRRKKCMHVKSPLMTRVEQASC